MVGTVKTLFGYVEFILLTILSIVSIYIWNVIFLPQHFNSNPIKGLKLFVHLLLSFHTLSHYSTHQFHYFHRYDWIAVACFTVVGRCPFVLHA